MRFYCRKYIQFHFTDADWEELRHPNADSEKILRRIVDSRNLPVNMLTNDGKINVCLKCGLIKPDRTHHCSTCNKWALTCFSCIVYDSVKADGELSPESTEFAV